jgi:hypothetical protein
VKPKKIEVKTKKEFMQHLEPSYKELCAVVWESIKDMPEETLNSLFGVHPLPQAMAILFQEVNDFMLDKPEELLN